MIKRLMILGLFLTLFVACKEEDPAEPPPPPDYSGKFLILSEQDTKTCRYWEFGPLGWCAVDIDGDLFQMPNYQIVGDWNLDTTTGSGRSVYKTLYPWDGCTVDVWYRISITFSDEDNFAGTWETHFDYRTGCEDAYRNQIQPCVLYFTVVGERE